MSLAVTLRLRAPRRRCTAAPGPRTDAGFSLVEALVAMALLAVVVTVTAAGVLQAAQATRLAHEDAQAADVLRVELESARSKSFKTLGMSASDLDSSADSRLQTSSGTTMAALGADGNQEQVFTVDVEPVSPHVVPNARGTRFKVASYVTQPSSCSACRRFSAVATWQSGGRQRARWASELIMSANRGVSEDWSWTIPGSASARSGSGGKVVVPLTLLNNGNRNSWSLRTTVTNASGPVTAASTAWYRDVNGNGAVDPGDTTLANDPSVAGARLTGNVESGRLLRLLAVVSVPAGGYTVTATSTSLMEPSTSSTPSSSPVPTPSSTCAPTNQPPCQPISIGVNVS